MSRGAIGVCQTLRRAEREIMEKDIADAVAIAAHQVPGLALEQDQLAARVGSRVAARAAARSAARAGADQIEPMTEQVEKDPTYGAAIRDFLASIPVGFPGSPEDQAAAASFLLGPEARFICGIVLFVDGGHDAMLRPDQF